MLACTGSCFFSFRYLFNRQTEPWRHLSSRPIPRHRSVCALLRSYPERLSSLSALPPAHAQFLAWDTFARQRVDMIGRKDHGDRVIAHEFDYSIKQQVGSAAPFAMPGAQPETVSPQESGSVSPRTLFDRCARCACRITGSATEQVACCILTHVHILEGLSCTRCSR